MCRTIGLQKSKQQTVLCGSLHPKDSNQTCDSIAGSILSFLFLALPGSLHFSPDFIFLGFHVCLQRVQSDVATVLGTPSIRGMEKHYQIIPSEGFPAPCYFKENIVVLFDCLVLSGISPTLGGEVFKGEIQAEAGLM